jgi:HrpA-like RNA helicase
MKRKQVHERDLNTDFLLIILKSLLARRPDLKLILMSATLNARTFADYFKTGSGALSRGPPLVEIPGRAHPVESFFLEHVMEVSLATAMLCEGNCPNHSLDYIGYRLCRRPDGRIRRKRGWRERRERRER